MGRRSAVQMGLRSLLDMREARGPVAIGRSHPWDDHRFRWIPNPVFARHRVSSGDSRVVVERLQPKLSLLCLYALTTPVSSATTGCGQGLLA